MEETPKTKSEKVTLKDVVSFIVLVAVIVIPIRLFIAQPFVVNGASMLPTFHTGEYLIVDQLTYNFSTPERGDVIIFKFPEDQSRFFIKRIIGLPNETIEMSDEEVKIINNENPEGFVLTETHITMLPKGFSDTSVTLEADEYFVLGDNRQESLDSRAWGSLKEDLIIGRAYLRLLPIDNVDYLPGKVEY